MTPPNTSVSIQIAQSDVIILCNYLIQHQIPFEINFQSHIISEALETSKQIRGPMETFEEIAPTDKSVVNIVKEIHQQYIIEEIGTIPPSEKEIAIAYNIGLVTFRNWFKKIYGRTFYQYYMEKKMEYATQLLKKGLTASDVATKVGYTHPIKFNKMFQKYVGMTPKKYQMQHYGSRNSRIRKV